MRQGADASTRGGRLALPIKPRSLEPRARQMLLGLRACSLHCRPLPNDLGEVVDSVRANLDPWLPHLNTAWPSDLFRVQEPAEPTQDTLSASQRRKSGLDRYLQTVSQLYWGRRGRHEGKDPPIQNGLESLLCPARVRSVFEEWSPREVATFQAAIFAYGKQFDFIAYLVRTKSATQVFEFYGEWKQSAHYRVWRAQANAADRQSLQA